MLRGTLLLVFAGALLGIGIYAAAQLFARVSRLPIAACVWIAVALGAALGLAAAAAGGGALVMQWELLSQTFHDALVAALRELKGVPAISSALAKFDPSSALANAGAFLQSAGGIVSGAFGLLIGVLLILFVAVAGALEPALYRRGFLALFAVPQRERLSIVLDEIVHTLRTWLVARLLSMCVTGVLVWIGLSILRVPLAGALGALAGALAFVPNIGAFIAGAPAIVIALAMSPRLALLVLFTYWLVHAIDDFFVSPFIERRMVRLPPILTIVAQLTLGIATGTIGVMLAAPLVAVSIIIVKRLWVDALERQVA